MCPGIFLSTYYISVSRSLYFSCNFFFMSDIPLCIFFYFLCTHLSLCISYVPVYLFVLLMYICILCTHASLCISDVPMYLFALLMYLCMYCTHVSLYFLCTYVSLCITHVPMNLMYPRISLYFLCTSASCLNSAIIPLRLRNGVGALNLATPPEWDSSVIYGGSLRTGEHAV